MLFFFIWVQPSLPPPHFPHQPSGSNRRRERRRQLKMFFCYFGFLKVLYSTLLLLRPSDSTVSMDAAMKSNPELLRLWHWQSVRRSNHSARSLPKKRDPQAEMVRRLHLVGVVDRGVMHLPLRQLRHSWNSYITQRVVLFFWRADWKLFYIGINLLDRPFLIPGSGFFFFIRMCQVDWGCIPCQGYLTVKILTVVRKFILQGIENF